MSTSKLAIAAAALSASLFIPGSILHAQDAAPSAPPATPAQSASASPAGGAQDFLLQMLQARDAGIKATLKVPDDEMGGDPAAAGQGREGAIHGQDVWQFRFRHGPRRPRGSRRRPGRARRSSARTLLACARIPGIERRRGIRLHLERRPQGEDGRGPRRAQKSPDDLAAARADLQKVLSVREEALLLNMGILE